MIQMIFGNFGKGQNAHTLVCMCVFLCVLFGLCNQHLTLFLVHAICVEVLYGSPSDWLVDFNSAVLANTGPDNEKLGKVRAVRGSTR